MTPEGVFFVALSAVRLNIWALCQQTHKDIYFLTYTGSLESNLLQMVIAKEKINLFMKGQDTDLDLIYEKFGIDYNLLVLLLHRGVDEEGNFQIRWGDQQIA